MFTPWKKKLLFCCSWHHQPPPAQPMELSEALAFLCGEHFIQVDAVFAQVMQPIQITTIHTELPADSYASWMAKGAHWFTLMKRKGQTVVYCHANDMMYFASPNVQLPPSIPDNYAFLAQTALDNKTQPRLLILDILLPDLGAPAARGQVLRQMQFPSTCHVQWAGEITSLRKFLHKGLPHEVECVFSLDKPLCIFREHVLKTNV